MKTPKLFLLSVLTMGVIMASCNLGGEKQTSEATASDEKTVEIETVTINPDLSRIIWAGTMLGIYTHEGTLNLTQADLSMEDGVITGGSFTADMKSMTPTDENYNPEQGNTPEKLAGHLMSADFFDVENFPTAMFMITKVEGNSLTGMLTIRGITNEEKVENVAMVKEGESVKISGDMTFDRKKYDVSWDSPMQDRILSNDVELKIELIGS